MCRGGPQSALPTNMIPINAARLGRTAVRPYTS
jgi:hypothetical protein